MLTTSTGNGNSDTQAACALSDALVAVASFPSVGNVTSNPKADMKDAVNASWESLLYGFGEWLQVEASAMKCANPIFPNGPDHSSWDDIVKHLGFNRIMTAWEDTCSCGERRTGLCYHMHGF